MLSLGPTLLMLSLQIKSNLMKCSKTVELRANHQSMSLISKQKNRILEHGCIMLYRSNTYWMKVKRVSLHCHFTLTDSYPIFTTGPIRGARFPWQFAADRAPHVEVLQKGHRVVGSHLLEMRIL